MGRPINKRDCCDKNHSKVHGSRPPGAMKEGILIDIVHIESRGQKPRGDEKPRRNRCLQRQSAAVVPYLPHRPEQRQGKTDVEARKQPHPNRYPCIPHVLRSADQKSSHHQPPSDVDGPKEPRRQRADRLAGNQQGTSPPQSRASEDHGDVTQMQKIRPPPYAHVGGKPHHHPNQRDPSQNWKRGRASGHASSPLEVSNAAQPTTGGCCCMQRVISRHSRRVSGGTIAAGNTLELAAGERRKVRGLGLAGKKTTTIQLKMHPAKSI